MAKILNPENDRLNYGEILAPPDGYSLDFAVGTTYSLDLDALVGACIALGLSAETDSALLDNPVFLLEALRTTGDKIALFCQDGQIHYPNKATSLYILLEKIVYGVTLKRRGNAAVHSSFHPKFWLIRYTGEGNEVLYRAVVLSRNLTFDRSWDTAFYMDGKPSNEVTDKNAPVADFLGFLVKNLRSNAYSKAKAKKIRTMIRELPHICFKTGSKAFYDFDFIPSGIPKTGGGSYSIKDCALCKNMGTGKRAEGLHELFIMSPFLSSSVVHYFNSRGESVANTEYILITRAMSLGRLKPLDADRFRIYVLKDAVVDGEGAISEETPDYRKQDIHAKIYMTRKYSDTDLYLGSFNASQNAVYHNVEFMIRLKSKNRYLNINQLKDALFCGDENGPGNPFQEISLDAFPDEQGENPQDVLDATVRAIGRLHPSAQVTLNGSAYDLEVRFDKYESPYNIMISPLLSKKSAAFAERIVFTSLAMTQLSEFYAVTVSDGNTQIQRVIIIPTEGLPEEREKAVVSSIVNDKACFYRYIAFLLGDDIVISALEADPSDTAVSGKAHRKNEQLPALYEKMLHTAAEYPDRFMEIDYLINSISEYGVIPEHFEELYSTFKKAVKR